MFVPRIQGLNHKLVTYKQKGSVWHSSLRKWPVSIHFCGTAELPGTTSALYSSIFWLYSTSVGAQGSLLEHPGLARPQLLTLQSVHERLWTSRVNECRRSSWSDPPWTSPPSCLCPTECRRSPRSPRRTCDAQTLGENKNFRRRSSVSLHSPWLYSRGVALCVGQVFHQNVQTFILIIEKLLRPSAK